ncbi:MAG: signal peptidase I [Gordonia sp.]|uniref:Signal peptidase I n=1 Tax=Gordonia rubripertincta TaxID=36822 RepID=A0ABT4MU14_GORRU|nr:signal peptidase I [Gordonia rubripertincta]MBA4024792.1 signal peptidase I [Gordonia sp. (in: high G+C Gram-positive bacteria)]MCZ4550329.1 signal peptidase I [Gordonia rubripertincta]
MVDTPRGPESSSPSGDDTYGDPDSEGARPWRSLSDKDESKPKKKGSILRETAIIIVCVLLLTWVLQTFVGRQYVIPSESMEPTLTGCAGCTNDRIVIDKLVYRFGEPKAGDVVVFKAPTSSWDLGWRSPRSDNTVVRGAQNAMSWFGFAPPDENNLVKRVIATGGQRVECHNADRTGVKVDGKPLVEPYIDMKLQEQNAAMRPGDLLDANGELNSCLGEDFGPLDVPAGQVWVMGDNRGNSADSRYHQDDELHGMVPVDDIRGKVRFVIYPFSRMGSVDSVNPQK